MSEYPWDGGDITTDVSYWLEGEKDQDGAPNEHSIVGLGDYVDGGEPDLMMFFPKGTPEAHVRWVALALEWFIVKRPEGVCEVDPDA